MLAFTTCAHYGPCEHKHRYTSSVVGHMKQCTNLMMHCILSAVRWD